MSKYTAEESLARVQEIGLIVVKDLSSLMKSWCAGFEQKFNGLQDT